MKRLTVITTKTREMIDLTDRLQALLDEYDISDGLCHLFLLHVTAALTTADIEPSADTDILNVFFQMVPNLPVDESFEFKNIPNYVLPSLIGTSISVPVQEGRLVLGVRQKIVMIENDGPRQRDIVVSFVGERK